MSSETFYNLSEACLATKLSPPTLRKYLKEGRFPNAQQTLKGKVQVWAIPLTDLVAAGLLGSVSGSSTSTDNSQALTGVARLEALAERAGRLQAELDQAIEQATKRAEFSELIAQSQIETKQVQDERRLTLLQRITGKRP